MKNTKEIVRLEKEVYATFKKLMENIKKGKVINIEQDEEYWRLVEL